MIGNAWDECNCSCMGHQVCVKVLLCIGINELMRGCIGLLIIDYSFLFKLKYMAHLSNPLRLVRFQRRRARRRRVREPRLHEYLLHVVAALVENLVHLVHLLDLAPVREHLVRVRLAVPDHLQQLLPVEVHGRLAVADEPDPALHERADVEVVGEADVDARDAAAAVVFDRGDHLVDDFRGVGFGADEHFEAVGPGFGVLARDALEGHVGAAVLHFLEAGCHGRAAGEVGVVEEFELGHFGLAEVEAPGSVTAVNHDDAACAVGEAHFRAHLADGSSAPDRYDVSLFYAGVDHTVPACG